MMASSIPRKVALADQPRLRPDRHGRADDAERPDLRVVRNAGVGIDRRAGMNVRHFGVSALVPVTSSPTGIWRARSRL